MGKKNAKSSSAVSRQPESADQVSNHKQPAPEVKTIWPLWVRIVASGFLVTHITAVFAPPFHFLTMGLGSQEASPVAGGIAAAVRPYCDFMFLQHGYAFFAPDPGPSHLLRCHVETAEQPNGFDIIFPDRTKQWPRLLYHRHFMLTETLNSNWVPASLPAETPADARQRWQAARANYDRLWKSYERHLTKKFGATSVNMTRIEHSQPRPDEFSNGTIKSLDQKELYRDLEDRPTFGGAP